MNTTITRLATAAVLAVLTLSTTACSEDAVSPRQQIQLPETGPEAVEVDPPVQPTECPSYLWGWERAHCR